LYHTHLMLFFILTLRPPRSPLFPYTTLFRSQRHARHPPAGQPAEKEHGFRHRRRHLDIRPDGWSLAMDHRCEKFHTPFPVGGYTDRKSTRLNSSHVKISYAVFCLKKKKKTKI